MRQETGITMPEEFKPVYLENEEYEVEKWSAKQLIKLLRLYGSHRCLWDHRDPFNKNRKMRKAAMIDITAAMGDDVTMEQVGQKINVIRSTYRYEKRRIKQRIRKGIGARTKLKWFALADSFLRNVPRAEKFKKSDAPPDSDSDLEDTVVFTIDPEILIPLEEDNSGNQNCISIGDSSQPQLKNDQEDQINEQMDEIHQMLEDHNEENFERTNKPWKWKSKQSMKFLKIYREHKCLWDCNDPTYKDRSKRGRAIKAIAQEVGGGKSERQVVRKINALRSTYRMERKKIAEAAAKGEKLESKLKWYNLADSFLRSFCQLKLRKNSDNSIMEDDLPPPDFDEDEFNNDQDASDNDNNDDFNDTHSFDSDDEPIARFKHEPETQIKTEFPSDEDSKPSTVLGKVPKIRIKPIKRPWTQAESLQFVELIRLNSCLWDRQHPNFMKLHERAKAFESIAFAMDIPVNRIRKKMKILLKAYHSEKRKIQLAYEKVVPYETNLIWYHHIDEFLSRKYDMPPRMAPMSFVDPDLMSPAPSLYQDPNNSKKIKQEAPDSPHDHFGFDVASPAPTHHSLDGKGTTETESTKSIAHPIKSEEPPPEEDFPKPESNDPPTKLVWNGLEDDLLEGKWSLKHSVKFLRLYGAHHCLWDLNDPDYRSRELRNAAMEDIAAAMGHGLDLEYVSKKIKIFRITYMQHRKRMLEALKTGQEPEIQLRWFPLADSFLRPHIGLRSIKPGEVEIPQYDFQYVYANLNLIDPALLNDFEGKGTQNSIQIGSGNGGAFEDESTSEQSSSEEENEDDFYDVPLKLEKDQ